MAYTIWIVLVFLVFFFSLGIRIVRPVEKGVVEFLGKFTSIREQGFQWIIPIFHVMRKVNITEQMVDVDPQMVITNDKLNAEVDAVVYYKVQDVKKSLYNVDDHREQLVKLSKTTLRSVIGTMTLAVANEERAKINKKIEDVLVKETKSYGVEILRVEIQRIEPPKDVQNSMNEVVKAEQEKIAALDLATATETKADGVKRAAIKEAEGIARGKVIVAEAEARRIQLVNEAAHKYFIGNAQKLRRLDVTQASLEKNSKIVLTDKGINPTLLIGKLPIDK